MGVVITKVPGNVVNDYAARRGIPEYYVAMKSYHLHETVLNRPPVKGSGRSDILLDWSTITQQEIRDRAQDQQRKQEAEEGPAAVGFWLNRGVAVVDRAGNRRNRVR